MLAVASVVELAAACRDRAQVLQVATLDWPALELLQRDDSAHERHWYRGRLDLVRNSMRPALSAEPDGDLRLARCGELALATRAIA